MMFGLSSVHVLVYACMSLAEKCRGQIVYTYISTRHSGNAALSGNAAAHLRFHNLWRGATAIDI